jgi:signal peptidase I
VFAKSKLRKLQKESRRWLARTRRDMKSSPHLFKSPEREALAQRLDALERQLEIFDFGQLERELKECKRLVDRHLPFYRASTFREYAEIVIVALLLALVIRTFIVQAFKIPSGSMIPTLLIGDHILVNKFLYGIPIPLTGRKIPLSAPKRGDIIVFKYPDDPSKDYIKRVIGVPGDTVEVRGTDLIINGQAMPKIPQGMYRLEDPAGYEQTSQLFAEKIDDREHTVLYDKVALRPGDIIKKVPPGYYFCMGDNRDHSNDSRIWGYVPEANIKGKALVIYFSWPPGQFLRIGKVLR